MKIYGDVISPFVRACLVASHELNLQSKVEFVVTAVKPTEPSDALVRLSPIGKIPVLETDHGHAIYDSRVIVEYLAHVAGNNTLIPDDGVKRFRVLTLQSLASGMADASVALRYELAQRPAELKWEALAERHRLRILAGVKDMETNWIPDLSSCNAGSIFAATALAYIDLRHGGIDWRAGNPRVTTFLETFSTRPSMKAYPLS
jgi:glutathione S-transferase